MRRLILLLLLLTLLPTALLAEEAPLTLRSATTAAEVKQFLLLPKKFALVSAKRGYIRYISQNEERDDMFRVKYWLGGEMGSALDLTLKERHSVKYPYHAGMMCSRAVYSMALSYLGVDITPGEMSAMVNSRNLDEPYDIISWLSGVERVKPEANVFNTMMENYLSDDSYSPVYLYFRRPNGTSHAVLVVAANPQRTRFFVVDSNPPQSGGKLYRVYFIALNKQRTEIVNSTFKEQLKGSKVVQICQWRLPAAAASAAE